MNKCNICGLRPCTDEDFIKPEITKEEERAICWREVNSFCECYAIEESIMDNAVSLFRFVESILDPNGPYPELNGTKIIEDAYNVINPIKKTTP